MSTIGALIAEKQQRTEAFMEQKAAERQELSDMTNDAISNVTQEPEAYLRYLDAQADNPGFSASNVLLVLRLPDKTVLEDGTPRMRLALRALLYQSPVKVDPVKDGSLDACYDPQRQIIDVSEALTDSQTFAALAREIFHAKAHESDRDLGGYSREGSALDAESAAYMLCRSFGVPCEKPDTTKLGVIYEGMEPQDARGFLNSIQSIFREMRIAVLREIEARQRQERKRARRLPEKSAAQRG